MKYTLVLLIKEDIRFAVIRTIITIHINNQVKNISIFQVIQFKEKNCDFGSL